MLHETDLSRADLNLLVLFEAVMRERHVGHAARRLNLSPSAVSHGLSRLRMLLGDPLFLRNPRGVVPTDRAVELAPRIDALLASVRGILSEAVPFDPATSTRHFRVGTADAALVVLSPALVRRLAAEAPALSLSFLNVLPATRFGTREGGAWDDVLSRLDMRALDLAILPGAAFPARFAVRPLGEDSLVAVTGPDHPFARTPDLDTYCASRHMLVSERGDPSAATDMALAQLGRSRRVVLTVPSFTVALAVAETSDMIVSVPRHLAVAGSQKLNLVCTPLPLDIPPSPLSLLAAQVAIADAGLAWIAGVITEAAAAVFGEKQGQTADLRISSM